MLIGSELNISSRTTERVMCLLLCIACIHIESRASYASVARAFHEILIEETYAIDWL